MLKHQAAEEGIRVIPISLPAIVDDEARVWGPLTTQTLFTLDKMSTVALPLQIEVLTYIRSALIPPPPPASVRNPSLEVGLASRIRTELRISISPDFQYLKILDAGV